MADAPITSLDHPALQRTRSAVIDIGSNSVRLVIYDGPRRAPFQICNEKALCGLGRDMTDDGGLNPRAMAGALDVLARFKRLLAEHGNPATQTVATAAVREASNGAEFVERIEALGLPVDVIGGGEEARLAAYGVVSFDPGASGLAGDMGGGSLELVSLAGGEIGDSMSLSIGPLRLMQQSKGDLKAAAKIIEKAFAGVDWLAAKKGETLFAVGGAWRSIARVNMQLHKHPLPVLHHYEMMAKQAVETCDLIAKQSRSSLELTPGISAKRIDTLPYASIVLKLLVEAAGLKTVSISAGGLREGLLYGALDQEIRTYDPLIAGAMFLGARMEPESDMGRAYAAFTAGAFPEETASEKRIRTATCLLADIGSYFHPDMRADQAFDTALRAPFYGVTHSERAAIAVSLFARYAGAKTPPSAGAIVGLLSESDLKRAMQTGLALRFGAALAPKAPHAIAQCSLARDEKSIRFSAPASLSALFDETAKKRLDALAASFGVASDVKFAD
jgi:exopolyphosphatase/guanosine-5'-triphosphate,3'-diphosphate pyrophosphatase